MTPQEYAEVAAENLCAQFGGMGHYQKDITRWLTASFIAQVQEEREACAKIAENHLDCQPGLKCAKNILDEIRARGAHAE